MEEQIILIQQDSNKKSKDSCCWSTFTFLPRLFFMCCVDIFVFIPVSIMLTLVCCCGKSFNDDPTPEKTKTKIPILLLHGSGFNE
jgi:hypothetical protein